jgi:type I restriction enzyme S subunit
MNSDVLIAHYDRISEAPDAIPRLRQFILDLAVRGKLVEQDPNDEPAQNGFDSIQPERLSWDESKNLLSPTSQESRKARVPNGWFRAKFAELYILEYGDNLPAEKRSNTGEFPVYGSNGVVGTHNECYVNEPCIVIGRKGSAGALNLSLSKGCCVTDVAYYCCPPKGVDIEYSFRLFQTLGFDKLGKGIKPGLSRKDVYNLYVTIPPKAEQQRIVAKVDELMALCDRLEEMRKEREKTRNQLVAGCFQRLSQPDEDEEVFREDARFTLNHLSRMTTRPAHIKQLRQAILSLAVRGKLVEQDPSDEPASELIKRTLTEKAGQLKVKGLSSDKPLPLISEKDAEFDLPSGWEWIRLGNLSQFVTSGSRDWARYYSDEGAIFIRMGNLSKDNYRLRLNHVQRVKPPSDSEGTRTRLEAGDILISITGDVGMLGLIPDNFGEAYINQHTAMVRPMSEMKGRYLAEILRSPFAKNQFDEPQRGIKNSFRLTDVSHFLVPLPPLAEQHRIVAKVDELMVLCDQLEAQMTAVESDSRRLLGAVLQEALGVAV